MTYAGFPHRVCIMCPAVYKPTSGAQKYCAECRPKAMRDVANRWRREQRAAKPRPRKSWLITCADCSLVVEAPSPRRERCDDCRASRRQAIAKQYNRNRSKEASRPPLLITCSNCGETVEAKRRTRTLCDDCAALRRRERAAAHYRANRVLGPYTMKCQECDGTWESSRTVGRFCPSCRSDRAKKQRKAYSERPDVVAKQRALAKERRYSRRHELATKYGLDIADYDAMVAIREGRCDICSVIPERSLCVDHDHATGMIRGLLCVKCNTALGLFRDNPVAIDASITYLLDFFENTLTQARREHGNSIAPRSDTGDSKQTVRSPDGSTGGVQVSTLGSPVDAARRHKLKKYGLSEAQYASMARASGNRCRICADDFTGTGKNLCVDHDHGSGLVRGLLCHHCNAGLGGFGEDVETLRAAARYLRLDRTPPWKP